MATSAQTFHQMWHPGVAVQEIAAPHRKGVIRAVKGTGSSAVIYVSLYGAAPAAFRPGQLARL